MQGEKKALEGVQVDSRKKRRIRPNSAKRGTPVSKNPKDTGIKARVLRGKIHRSRFKLRGFSSQTERGKTDVGGSNRFKLASVYSIEAKLFKQNEKGEWMENRHYWRSRKTEQGTQVRREGGTYAEDPRWEGGVEILVGGQKRKAGEGDHHVIMLRQKKEGMQCFRR